MLEFPPLNPTKLARLKAEIALIPSRHREDALQEAWVAHLEGTDEIAAAKTYAKAEFRHEQRRPEAGSVNMDRLRPDEIADVL